MGQAGNGTQQQHQYVVVKAAALVSLHGSSLSFLGVLQYVPAHGGWCFLLREEPEARDGMGWLRSLGCCSAHHGCHLGTWVGCQEQQPQLTWIAELSWDGAWYFEYGTKKDGCARPGKDLPVASVEAEGTGTWYIVCDRVTCIVQEACTLGSIRQWEPNIKLCGRAHALVDSDSMHLLLWVKCLDK